MKTHRRDGAARHRVDVGGEHRQLGVVADLDHRLERRDDRVVGRHVKRVGLADQGAGGGQDLARLGRRAFQHGHAVGGRGFLHRIQRRNGIGLARIIEHAQRLRVRQDALDHLKMPIDRRAVRRAGHVGARMLPALDELGADRIGDGGEDHRNILGAGDHRLGGRSRDGDNHVRFLADEFLGDLHGGRHVALGAFVGPFQVLALDVPGFRQHVLDPLAARIERRMLRRSG